MSAAHALNQVALELAQLEWIFHSEWGADERPNISVKGGCKFALVK
jgi:hypothetical protein